MGITYISDIKTKTIAIITARSGSRGLPHKMYLVKVKHFLEDNYIYDENCYAYIMPQENSIDVDTELDFVIAEAVMQHLINNDGNEL